MIKLLISKYIKYITSVDLKHEIYQYYKIFNIRFKINLVKMIVTDQFI